MLNLLSQYPIFYDSCSHTLKTDEYKILRQKKNKHSKISINFHNFGSPTITPGPIAPLTCLPAGLILQGVFGELKPFLNMARVHQDTSPPVWRGPRRSSGLPVQNCDGYATLWAIKCCGCFCCGTAPSGMKYTSNPCNFEQIRWLKLWCVPRTIPIGGRTTMTWHWLLLTLTKNCLRLLLVNQNPEKRGMKASIPSFSLW